MDRVILLIIMNPYFKIPNTVNYDPQQLKPEYKDSNNYPNWLDKFEELKECIKEWNRKKTNGCKDRHR